MIPKAQGVVRAEINAHLKRYARNMGLDMPSVNRAAKKVTGRGRGDMSYEELASFLKNINKSFPVI